METKHLDVTANEIVSLMDSFRPKARLVVPDMFAELTQVQAIYVAARVAKRLQDPGDLASVMVLDSMLVLDIDMNAARLARKDDVGHLVQMASCHPRSDAVALVALVQAYADVADKVAERCIRAAEHQIDEVA